MKYFFFVFLFVCISYQSSITETWRVPSECLTIQAGIDSAAAGDTVLMAQGTYTGEGNRDIDFLGKTIVVMSEAGPDSTIIDCEGSAEDPHRGFYFHEDENKCSILDGFTVKNGYSYDGGGICCESSYFEVAPVIANCVITENTAYWRGGGIFCYMSNPIISNCNITFNTALEGGGFDCEDTFEPLITDCYFFGNTAELGGGLCCFDSWLFIENCTISNNTAQGTGGGINCYTYSSPDITNSIIKENIANDGGGIFCGWSCAPTITGCTIVKNTAVNFGAGINLGMDVWPRITNSTIAGNIVGISGGGVYCNGSMGECEPILINCILWGDSPDEIFVDSGTPEITYTNVQGGWSGEGNIDTDPFFIDPDSDDFHLQSHSPCIDSGTDSVTVSLDIDGQPIPYPCADPLYPPAYDMGSDERWPQLQVTMEIDPQAVAPGDTCDIFYTLHNPEQFGLRAVGWIDVYLPSGKPYSQNPYLGPSSKILHPGEFYDGAAVGKVKSNALGGLYIVSLEIAQEYDGISLGSSCDTLYVGNP